MGLLRTLTIVVLLPLALWVFVGGFVRAALTSIPAWKQAVHFTTNDVPDMTGKVVVITGGNAGLGFESAVSLAEKGAKIVIACRSLERGRVAVREINEKIGRADAEVLSLELSSFKSIARFAEDFKARYNRLDVLMLNAGKAYDFQLTEDGYEPNMGIHHLGHAYLTFLLLPLLKETKPSRVVVLTSFAHYWASPFSNLSEFISPVEEKVWGGRYGQSKLANIFFTRKLSLELERRGVNWVFVNAVHPGWVITDFGEQTRGFFARQLGFNAHEGALTQIYAASHPDIVNKRITGEYLHPIAQRGIYGYHTSMLTTNWTAIDEFWEWTVNELYRHNPSLDDPLGLLPNGQCSE